jgi:hypothetical protein
MPEKDKSEKDIDYLHPNGKAERRPHGEQEKKNQQKAEESTELAEELKPTESTELAEELKPTVKNSES